MTTAPDQQSFDQILEQTFPKDIQQKRIRKELISLNDLDQNYYKINLQNSPLGLKVVVEFTELFIQKEIQQNSNLQFPIILELLLDPQFPFNLPKLFCRTPIFQPSLADGRDFLEDAIERPWSPTILLREVITSIPTFLKKINRLQDPADSQKMGQYYIGDLYSLEDMLGYETVNLFTGEEVIEKKSTTPRYIVVAESHFLKFETADNSRNTLRLLTWANLNSIANIKRSKDDERSVLITFLDKEKTNGIAQLMLLTKESNRLEELLMDLGERYGARIKQGAISDFDLTPYTTKLSRQITEKNVEEVLEDIHQLETRLEIEVTKDLVYNLMAFYQKIVEHFATYDDPLVDEFVSKLRSLMEREDVQTALKNNQENEERKKTQTLTKQKSMDTDIEDEEEKKESNEPYSWQDQDDNLSLDGNERVAISQSQKLEVQRPVPVQEEVKAQQQEEENEWKEFESKGTEEAEKETHQIPEYKQEEQYVEPQENIENRQEEFVEPEPQVQAQEEENIPVQEEAQIEQREQQEEVQVQENKEEEFEGYQQEEQQAQEIQPEYQQNFQEEQAYVHEEVPVQNEEPVQQAEEVVPEYKEEEVQREEQQEENIPVQEEGQIEYREQEEQQEEVQVQENKEEEAIENKEENQVIENEEKREEFVEENQVQEQAENIEEVVNEPVEEKEEAIGNKEEAQVQENKEEEIVENREEQQEEKREEENQAQEQEEVKESQEENKNEEGETKVEAEAEENQGGEEEQSPEKAEANENENEEEAQGQEQGQGEGGKKKKNKKNKKKK